MKQLYYTLLCFTIPMLSLAQQGLKPLKWNTYPIKNEQKSAAFIEVHDLNKDGIKEVLMTTLIEEGNGFSIPFAGALRVFNSSTDQLNTAQWQEKTLVSTSEKLGFINEVFVFDINEDGQEDILLPTGFLSTNGGSLEWLAGPDFTTRQPITEETTKGNTLFFWHQVIQLDLDQDGYKDLITTSTNVSNRPPMVRVEWYRHLGNGKFEQHIIAQNTGGVFIVAHDFDQDGDPDLALSQFFGGASLVWLEQIASPSATNNWQGSWKQHVIDNTTGLGYAMKVHDIDADGQPELVYCNHNNQNNTSLIDSAGNPIPSGVYWFEIPNNPDKEVWPKHVISEGFEVTNFDFGNPASQGSPGIFDIGDIDGNGYPDIILPGDGTKNLYALRQQANHTFTRETIAQGTMFGMAKVVDWDGDGDLEVVASMHNAPANFDQAQNPPPGHIKIYDPVIKKSSKPWKVSLYPMPIYDKAFIRLNVLKRQKVQVKLYDKFARVTYNKRFQTIPGENILELDLSALPPDFYLLKLRTKYRQKVWRVVVK